MAQLKAPAAVGDTLWQTDFKLKPATFPSGDMYTASTGNANKETVVGGVTFGAGPNGERINFANAQSANQFGSIATTYVSQTAADDGATPGAFSFIKTGTGAGGGYVISPQVQGPCNISVWACSGLATSQAYDVYFIINGGAPVFQSTTSIVGNKYIKKNVYSYTGTGLVQIKCVMSSTITSANTNLYFYNMAFVQGAPPTTPSLTYTSGLTAQTVYQAQTIRPILYQFGGSATSASIAWTGTSSSTIAPDGVTVTTVGNNVTIAGALNTLGSYGYSITATDGTNVTSALTGTLNTKTTTKYKMAYVTTVTAGAPAAGDLYFINGFTNNPGNDGLSKDFDLTYISATDTGIDYSIYDVILESSIPPSGSAGLSELKTKCLSKPFVNMKEFQLQASAWAWAVPGNTAATTMIVPDAVKSHPIFSGITFSGSSSNEIILTTATTGNMAVNLTSFSGTPTPAVPTTLSTTKDPSSGVSTGLVCYFEIPVGTTMNGMSTPTSAKQVVLGLSESTYNTGTNLLTADAITLAVNAAKYVIMPALSLTSGSSAQVVHATTSISNVVYTYISTATSTNVVWTGTASSTTAPDGIVVTTDATAKTITISGTPTTIGDYGYSVSALDGSVTLTLSGTLTVSTVTGVQSTINSKTIVSKEFYDVTGKKVNQYSHGLLIEKSVYTDGSNSFKKIYRPEF